MRKHCIESGIKINGYAAKPFNRRKAQSLQPLKIYYIRLLGVSQDLCPWGMLRIASEDMKVDTQS